MAPFAAAGSIALFKVVPESLLHHMRRFAALRMMMTIMTMITLLRLRLSVRPTEVKWGARPLVPRKKERRRSDCRRRENAWRRRDTDHKIREKGERYSFVKTVHLSTGCPSRSLPSLSARPVNTSKTPTEKDCSRSQSQSQSGVCRVFLS